MNPSAALPRENDAVADCPNQLILGDNFMKDAAGACIRVPNLLTFTGRSVCDSNGPRLALTVWAKWKPALRDSDTQKRDSSAVRRPCSFAVGVHARFEIDEGLRRNIVDRDEAMISPAARKSQLRAIWGPAQLACSAIRMNQLLGFFASVQLRNPHLRFEDEGDAASLGGYRRRMALAKFFWGAAVQ